MLAPKKWKIKTSDEHKHCTMQPVDITAFQGWKMARKNLGLLGFLQNLNNLKSPKFRLFRFFLFFGEILYKSYLISYFNCDLWILL